MALTYLPSPDILGKPLPDVPVWYDGLVSVTPVIDTVWILTRGYERHLYDALVRHSDDVKVRKIKDRFGNVYWYAYRVTRPTAKAIGVLTEWGHAIKLSRVDIALDFRFVDDVEAELFKRWCAAHLELRWLRQRARGFWFIGTRYYVDFRKGKSPRRTMKLYTKQQDKRLIRLEMKFLNAAAVRKNNLHHLLSEHKTFSPRDLFYKHVMLRQVRPGYVLRKTKAALGRRRDLNLKAEGKSEAHLTKHIIRWTRTLLERRVAEEPKHDIPMVKMECVRFWRVLPDTMAPYQHQRR